MNQEHLYDVIETNENNCRNVISAPELWIEDNVLSWPPKGAFTKRKNPTPPEEGWTKIPCTILKKGFTSLKSALAEEKRLSRFSNTESEAEDKRRKENKRKHPVLSQNRINLNQQFNKIKEEKVKETKHMKTIIFDPVVPEEMLASASTDNYCQENDLSALSSIDGHGENNLSNTDTVSNNNIEEEHVITLQQPSSSVSKSLPPSKQYPPLTNITPNWPRINVPHSTMASTSMSSTSMPTTSKPSTSMATTSKINIIENKQIVGSRTEGNGKIKQFQPNTKATKLGKTIGNKNYQNLKSVLKKNEQKKMNKPKERQIVKGKKQVKALVSKDKIHPRNLIENRGDSSGGQSIQYIKLIHKEILALKTFNKNEALKRRETDKKITEGLQKLEAEILELKDSSKMSVQDLILEQEQIQQFDTYFPITDQQEIETFVFKLSRDPVYKNLLKLRLARIGGTKPQLMIRAIMKYLVHDSLLLDYSWTGTETKGSFQDLTILNNTILESIQMQHRLYTEKEYNKYMKNFVNQAKFRLVTENYNHEGVGEGGEEENEEENKEENVENGDNENDEIYGYEDELEDEDEYSGGDEKEEGMVEYEYLDESE